MSTSPAAQLKRPKWLQGKCGKCNGRTSDDALYCAACSALPDKCKTCGVNPIGWHGNKNSVKTGRCIACNRVEANARAADEALSVKQRTAEAEKRNEASCALTIKEMQGDIGAADAVQPATSASRLEFPEDSMYGAAGELTRQLNMPLGLAYPAILACWSIKPDNDKMVGTRVNLMVALCAAVGGGKNVAMDRAQRLIGLIKDVEYKKAAPPGTRALMTLLGDKPAGGKNSRSAPRVAGPRKMLLITHEMTDILKMTGIDNSTLASYLCDLWDDSEKDYPTRDNTIAVNCRLSWIGGVPCTADNPTRFTELFDSETSHGLYDRLIIGYSDTKFNYRDWEPPSIVSGNFEDFAVEAPGAGYVNGMTEEAKAMFEVWEPEGGGSRIKQNCMKVALLTTMINREETISAECMRCAIRFMQWQIDVRSMFQPGTAVNDSARCRMIILNAMESKGARVRHINLKRLSHDRKWGDRFGDWLVESVIKSLASMGEIMPLVEENEKGETVKNKSMFKLRDFSE